MGGGSHGWCTFLTGPIFRVGCGANLKSDTAAGLEIKQIGDVRISSIKINLSKKCSPPNEMLWFGTKHCIILTLRTSLDLAHEHFDMLPSCLPPHFHFF